MGAKGCADVPDRLVAASMLWMDFKTLLTDATGLSRDALHIFTGLGLHLVLVLAFRSWFGALWPVGIVLLFAVGNEWVDLTTEVWTGELARQYAESAKDLATTLSAPLTLLLLSRYASPRFRPQATPSE